jgi:hypothetical protein
MKFTSSTRGTQKASFASIASFVKAPSLLPIVLSSKHQRHNMTLVISYQKIQNIEKIRQCAAASANDSDKLLEGV